LLRHQARGTQSGRWTICRNVCCGGARCPAGFHR
jgi:hypothetical protein